MRSSLHLLLTLFNPASALLPRADSLSVTLGYPPNWTLRSICVTDASGSNRLLSFQNPSITSSNTPAACTTSCNSQNFAYAGVQFGNECWCGNALNTAAGAGAPSNSCTMPCAGDAQQFCGGGYAMEIFEKMIASSTSGVASSTSVFAAPSSLISDSSRLISSIIASSSSSATASSASLLPTASGYPSNWVLQSSCLTDAASPNRLLSLQITTSSNTPSRCIATCNNQGYIFAGVQFGTECWCGNTLFTAGGAGAPSVGCNFACAGDASQMCGGGYAMQLFQRVDQILSSSFPSPILSNTISVTVTSASSFGLQSISSSSSSSSSFSVATSSIPSVLSSTSLSSATISTSTSVSASSTAGSVQPSEAVYPANWALNADCVSDAAAPNRLLFLQLTSNTNTPTTCILACNSRGFIYAGVQFGIECWCGNSLYLAGGAGAPSSGCTVACAGDSSQVCGGGYAMKVFQRVVAPSSSSVLSWTSYGSSSTLIATASSAASTFLSSSTIVSVSSTPSSTAASSYGFSSIITRSALSSASTVTLSSTIPLLRTSTSTTLLTSTSTTISGFASPSSAPTSSGTSTSSSGQPTPTTYPLNWAVKANCVTDVPPPNRLLTLQLTVNSNTPVTCITSCDARGFVYAAVQFGLECWCGNTLNTAGGAGAPSSSCNVACAGDPSQLCGGSYAMQLFQKTTTSSSNLLSSIAASVTSTYSASSATISSATASVSLTSTDRSFSISQYKLYPENAVYLTATSSLYLTQMYTCYIFRYNPGTGASTAITLPGVTNNATYHCSGIALDNSKAQIWALANSATSFQTFGGDLTGPNFLFGIDTANNIVSRVDLRPVQLSAKAANGNVAVGGYQDMVTDTSGNIYVIGTFGMLLFQAGTDIAQEIAKGNFIAKVNAASATASLFYATPNPRSGYGYSGIAIYGNRYLLVWDSLTASISNFDIRTGNKLTVMVSNFSTSPWIGHTFDSVRLIKNGNTLVVNDDSTSGILIFTSSDGWNSANYRGYIQISIPGGTPTFTYEMNSVVYVGFQYFGDDPNVYTSSGGTRSLFPQVDVTRNITALLPTSFQRRSSIHKINHMRRQLMYSQDS